MVKPLSSLLKEAWEFTQKNIIAIAGMAVAIGVLIFLLQLATGAAMFTHFQGTTGMSPEMMQNLAERAQMGDEAAVEEMMERVDLQKALMGFVTFSPVLILIWFVTFVLQAFAGAFYFLLVLKPGKPMDVVNNAFQKFIPFLALSLWMGIRSFAWVPFIGFIFAIIFFPRFILAPVYLLEDNKGVFESVKMSMAKTSGYWGKIFGNILVAGIIFWIISVIASMIYAPLGTVVMTAGIGYMAAFTVKLGKSVEANK